MPTGLQRDLGLPETTAVAMGAMVGAGIFILPGIAYAAAGPAVVFAYLLAGLLVLPAALSAAEMATAMPQDGGSYVYVERGMGPVLGTLAGVGNWFMLSFKSALALVGGVPYLVFVAPGLADYVVPLALALAAGFTLVNIISTKSTGSLQFLIVGIMLIVMVGFFFGGLPSIDPSQTAGSFDPTASGILAATGLVFVSYAGVIKVAAIAEEVEDPDTTLPRAMIGALLGTTVLYVLVVFVAIGVADDLSPGGGFVPAPGEEAASLAVAAESAFGSIGALLVVIAALLALASTANAGLLSASRFPFAMARDNLAPERFEHLSDRFATPVTAVGVTGLATMLMIAIFPIDQVAKLGSAFQILVFILVNVAIVGFREGAVEEYDPAFVAPFYPWLQVAGIGGGLVVLTQMGTVPIVGAVVISALALVWYGVYARPRIDREGAARTGVRESVGQRSLERTRNRFERETALDVLVAITEDTPIDSRRDMVRMATDLGRIRSTKVSVVEFVDIPGRWFEGEHAIVKDDRIPDWVPNQGPDAPDWFPVGTTVSLPALPSGGEVVGESGASARIEYREVDSEDHRQAIVDLASYDGYDLVVLERRQADFHRRLFGGDVDWILRNAPSDVVLVEDDDFDGADEITVVTDRGPFDPLKLLIADAIAEETGAELHLLQALPASAVEGRRKTVERYHHELLSILTVPARSTILETDDRIADLARYARDSDLLVTRVDRTGLTARLLGRPRNRLVDSVDTTAIMVQPKEDRQTSLLQRLLMDHLFG